MTEPTRREALGLATTAAAFAAAGRLPTLAAPNPVPVGLSPVRGHLGDHSLAKGPAKASLLRYAVLRWRNTDPSTGDTTNQEIGTLELKVERSSEEIRVGVLQTTRYSRPQNRFEARIACSPDDLLTLRSWTLDSVIEGREDLRYTVSGRREGDEVRIEDDLSERVIPVQGPLASQWTLMLAVAARPSLQGSLGLLEDLLLHKPGQRLTAEPRVRVPLGGVTHELACHSCRGQGILPSHYFSDKAGRAQLVTQGALAWALTEVL